MPIRRSTSIQSTSTSTCLSGLSLSSLSLAQVSLSPWLPLSFSLSLRSAPGPILPFCPIPSPLSLPYPIAPYSSSSSARAASIVATTPPRHQARPAKLNQTRPNHRQKEACLCLLACLPARRRPLPAGDSCVACSALARTLLAPVETNTLTSFFVFEIPSRKKNEPDKSHSRDSKSLTASRQDKTKRTIEKSQTTTIIAITIIILD